LPGRASLLDRTLGVIPMTFRPAATRAPEAMFLAGFMLSGVQETGETP
jgi:hypothetical protein